MSLLGFKREVLTSKQTLQKMKWLGAWQIQCRSAQRTVVEFRHEQLELTHTNHGTNVSSGSS